MTWLALGGMLFFSAMTAIGTPASLDSAGVHLSVAEMVLYLLDDPLYVSWGILLPFAFVVCPMAYSGEMDLLVAPRSSTRAILWRARLAGFAEVGLVYLAILLAALVLVSAASSSFVLDWSTGYRAAVSAVTADSSGTLPPVYALLVDNGYLFSRYSPLGALVLQVAMFFLALLLIGTLAGVLATLIEQRGLTFMLVMAWLLSGLMLGDGAFGPIYTLTPLVHVLTETRSEHFPYVVSFVYFLASISFLCAVGNRRSRSVSLG